jgi:hypothetical protein
VKKYWHIFVGIALLLAGVRSASALLVNISATWASGTPYLQNGSIVQVVVYKNDPGYQPSQTIASENFDSYGTTGDTTAGSPSDKTVYIPDSTNPNSGNVIVATGIVTGSSEDGFSFEQYVYLDNYSQYDRIYIRVFSATEFSPDEPLPSYWGISDAKPLVSQPGGIAVAWWDNVTVTNYNYFEVIPEPGTLGMLWSGAFGMGMAGLARRGRRRGNTRDSEMGDGKP